MYAERKMEMHEEMKDEIDLRQIFYLLLSRIWLILIITIIGGAAAFCFSKFMLPLEYSSHLTMYAQSYTAYADDADQPVVTNNITTSKQLINTYIQVLKDDAVLNAVGDKLTEAFDENTLSACFTMQEGKPTPASIRSALTITAVTDTSALTVNARTKDADVAAALCNDLAAVAPEFVQEAVHVGTIGAIDTAKSYKTPIAPNNTKNAAIGALAAFVIVVAIIVLADMLDNTVKDSDTLGRTYSKAVLGEMQEFSDEKKKKKKKKDAHADDHMRLTDQNVPFYIVESYKSIRTNISFALSTSERKIFAVSSANLGEGKSTMSANIAIAMAQGRHKVLLIDADMRKAVQHKIFELKNKKGLSTAVSKMNKVEDCIQRNVMDHLDVLTAGPTPPNPSELLASNQMRRILDQLSQEYDVIIIDTPPVNVVTDAMELAKNISGIVVVLRYGVTRNEDVEMAMRKIEFAQMNMLGFILNDIKVKRAGGYYKNYRYSYKYGYKKYGYGYGYGYGGKSELEGSAEDKTEKDDKNESNEKKK